MPANSDERLFLAGTVAGGEDEALAKSKAPAEKAFDLGGGRMAMATFFP
jgi:hypothetical protein